jgi:hypothetical protein
MPSRAVQRLLVFVILAVHMQAGPLFEQVLWQDIVPLGMSWRMYASPGNNVCVAQWFTASPTPGEGTPLLTPIDRFEVLGVEEPWHAPGNMRRQYSPRDLQLAANKLCDKLREKVPEADVRARARCGVQRGLRWKHVLATNTPLCGRPLPPVPKRPGKP